MSDRTFRKSGIYRHRFMWWYPWGVTRWWVPRFFTSADEWCNESACFVVPPFGCAIIFWKPGKLRAMPCSGEWRGLDDEARADYAPCGWLAGGRLRRHGHKHWETGVCSEARLWLDAVVPLKFPGLCGTS